MANILLNRSFETGNIDNWNLYPIGTSQSSDQAFDGTYSCKIENPTTDYSHRGVESDQVPAGAGLSYTVGAWFYIEDTGSGIPASSTATHVRMRLAFYDSAHTLISYGVYNPSYPDWGYTNINIWDSWFYKFFSFTAPAYTQYVSVILEAREENNPSPPPTGQPDNNVYFDYAIIEETYPDYSADNQRILSCIGAHYDEDDQRILSAIGAAHSADNQRIWGYIMDDLPSDDSYRIWGLIAEHCIHTNFLIVGEITRRTEWLDEPDTGFLAEEAKACNFPQRRVLYFHDLLPVNPVPGPGGATRYIDLTEKVMQIGSINRDIPVSPTDSPELIVSDLKLSVSNRDYYFSDRSADSPFYGILSAGGNYIGWKDGGRIEIWCGFNYPPNVTKLIKKAKMVIVSIETQSDTGTASISLRDYVSNILDIQVGLPDALTGAERPLEYPVQNIIAGTNGALNFYTNLAGWVTVTLPTGSYGKHTRAIIMTELMNASALVTLTGDDMEEFKVEFDEETQRYTFSFSGGGTSPGITTFKVSTQVAGAAYVPFALGGWTIYDADIANNNPDILSPNDLTATVINFTTLLENLLEDDGGMLAVDVDIETIAGINFMNVRWDSSSLLSCISEVAQCGMGAMWMTDDGVVYFKTFNNLVGTVSKALEVETDYRRIKYIGQDADNKIRKVTVTGKFEAAYAEVDSGSEIGTEYNITNNLVETEALATSMAEAYFSRYNVVPVSLKIEGEYLPSLELTDRVSVVDPSSPNAMLGQVTKLNLNPSSFTSQIELHPFVLSHTWKGRADWESYVSPDGGLYVPHDRDYLQTKLLALTGDRSYVFDSGSVGTRWVNLVYEADLSHKVFFLDHADESWIGRYTFGTLGSQNINLGAYSYDATNYRMIIQASADNTSVFAVVDGLLDEVGGGHYSDYTISNAWLMTGILGNPVDPADWTLQNQGHYFGQVIRHLNSQNYLLAFVKCLGGSSSPRLAAFMGGSLVEYLNQSYYDAGGGYAYLSLDSVYSQQVGFYGTTGHQAIPNHIDQGEFPLTSSLPVGPTLAGVGFARCSGYIYNTEMWTYLAPDALDPTFEYYTSPDGIVWAGPYSSISGLSGRYIKIKVTLSRATKYDTIPFLKSMTVSYSS